MWIWIAIAVIAAVVILFFLFLHVVYKYIFRRTKEPRDPRDIPAGPAFDVYRGQMAAGIEDFLKVPFEEVSIQSFDGLTLFGKYYHHKDDAPLMILFHGYRSSDIRDNSGVIRLCRERSWNALVVVLRGHGKSGGNTISFGVKERYDVVSWCRYAVDRFGPDVQILLGGVSMGAATVMMAADHDLPENVKAIEADCGYTSPKDIICCVAKQRGFPVKPAYFFAKCAARIYGHFDPEESSARESLRHAKVPVLFIHGEGDEFVPCRMSRENYEACTSEKVLFTVPKAPHGISYYYDFDGYRKTVFDFGDRVLA